MTSESVTSAFATRRSRAESLLRVTAAATATAAVTKSHVANGSFRTNTKLSNRSENVRCDITAYHCILHSFSWLYSSFMQAHRSKKGKEGRKQGGREGKKGG